MQAVEQTAGLSDRDRRGYGVVARQIDHVVENPAGSREALATGLTNAARRSFEDVRNNNRSPELSTGGANLAALAYLATNVGDVPQENIVSALTVLRAQAREVDRQGRVNATDRGVLDSEAKSHAAGSLLGRAHFAVAASELRLGAASGVSTAEIIKVATEFLKQAKQDPDAPAAGVALLETFVAEGGKQEPAEIVKSLEALEAAAKKACSAEPNAEKGASISPSSSTSFADLRLPKSNAGSVTPLA